MSILGIKIIPKSVINLEFRRGFIEWSTRCHILTPFIFLYFIFFTTRVLKKKNRQLCNFELMRAL
jgi:hypothetical protein